MAQVRVQAEDFDPGQELGALAASAGSAGAIGSFIGLVRSTPEHPILAMTLEHYPAMTVHAIEQITHAAEARFALQACTVIHRFGRLLPGARIVFVGTAARHRHAALDATAFLIDWLKTKAPFWKQEELPDGRRSWVAATGADAAAADQWDARK